MLHITWDPLTVVFISYFSEVALAAWMRALGRRRGITGRSDRRLLAFEMFLKGSFMGMTLMVLALVLMSTGASAKVPAGEPSDWGPEQLTRWMTDERAAVLHLQEVVVAAIVYLALQLFMAFSKMCRALMATGQTVNAAMAQT